MVRNERSGELVACAIEFGFGGVALLGSVLLFDIGSFLLCAMVGACAAVLLWHGVERVNQANGPAS